VFDLQPLSAVRERICHNTISSNAFYMLVGSALLNRGSLSVVRMGDGERLLMKEILDGDNDETWLRDPARGRNEKWMEMLGCAGISRGVLFDRLVEAGNECDYFAPSLSGINRPDYDLYSFFKARSRFVDNFFVDEWTDAMKIKLYQIADHVLFIHRNPLSAKVFRFRLKYSLGVEMSYLQMSTWQEADEVIAKAAEIDAPLVLFSGGPAGKFIGPRIARGGSINKVVIDLGHASDPWLLEALHKDALAAQARVKQETVNV